MKAKSGFMSILSLIITVLIVAFLFIYMNRNPRSKSADGRPAKTYSRELIDKAKTSADKASSRTNQLDDAKKELGLE